MGEYKRITREQEVVVLRIVDKGKGEPCKTNYVYKFRLISETESRHISLTFVLIVVTL